MIQWGYYKGGGGKLDYSVWWKEVTELLGKENVFFLPFELLKESRSVFLKRWLGFIGVEKPNAIANSFDSAEKKRSNSISEHEWSVRKPSRDSSTLGIGIPLSFWPFGSRRDGKICLTVDLSEEILSTYRHGNKFVDDKITCTSL